ncbi:hypothetical protein NHF50_11685 [Flavobacterium sp. NRK F10]|uniref:hypothetical protein n=1 Tax=Flavobacterium sp. NRK F10 TaxID=2954931 RepID=UPI0020907DA0|nr:hypothetical protein [Flavobacterium sp. NRK F10]MCO6175702.1 hypothetical protein [Flavobacterium sp. NRK F10]
MKKILTLIAALLISETYADKIEVYNNTNYDLSYNITTHDISGNPYPYLQSSGTSTLVTLNSWSSAVYDNNLSGTFPFYSPLTTPPINTWGRYIAAGYPAIDTPSNIAQNIYGTSQTFAKFKFLFAGTSFSANVGPLGYADFDAIYDPTTSISIQYFEGFDGTNTVYYILADEI